MLDPKDIPVLYKECGSLRAIGRKKGLSIGIVQRAYRKAVDLGLCSHTPMGAKTKEQRVHPSIPAAKQRVKALKTGRMRSSVYIVTDAQNNTNVHEKLWANLVELAANDGATILVGCTYYHKRGFGTRHDIGPKAKRDQDEIWFDPKVVPYIKTERVEIAKGLVWCGELTNILPTADRPLSGLENYTGRKSTIVPHTHLALQSIPGVGGSGAKLNYTTGAVTLRNYITSKAGYKAEFHHTYGALLVETDDEGHWWVRQLVADSDGTIHDLDRMVKDGKVTTGHRVEAITHGDIHIEQVDPVVKRVVFGKGGVMDALRPRHQFIHDLIDMYPRGHHIKDDPYKGILRYERKMDSVEAAVDQGRDFLRNIFCKDTTTHVVPSNHDRHLARWLAENDGRKDPVNANYWSYLNNEVVSYIKQHKQEPDVLSLAISLREEVAHFIPPDGSYVICKDFGDGIECGLHYDQGVNGARGSLRGFSRMIGRRSNGGHSHSCGIDGGAWQAGTYSLLQLEYNHGPSSWSHSFIITHENSKRQIVTIFNGKWRA